MPHEHDQPAVTPLPGPPSAAELASLSAFDQPASEQWQYGQPASCLVTAPVKCPWCDHVLPLPDYEYDSCPKCRGSFSFRKPEHAQPPASEPTSGEICRCVFLRGLREVRIVIQGDRYVVESRESEDGEWKPEYAPESAGAENINTLIKALLRHPAAHGEREHRAWYPHSYGQRGNCGCESCTKLDMGILEAENVNLREHSAALEAERDRTTQLAESMRRQVEERIAELNDANTVALAALDKAAALEAANAALQARLDGVAGLVEKWRDRIGHWPGSALALRSCADELEAALKGA
jgi:hypothetical protein